MDRQWGWGVGGVGWGWGHRRQISYEVYEYQSTDWEYILGEYSHKLYLTKDLYPEYMKNSYIKQPNWKKKAKNADTSQK